MAGLAARFPVAQIRRGAVRLHALRPLKLEEVLVRVRARVRARVRVRVRVRVRLGLGLSTTSSKTTSGLLRVMVAQSGNSGHMALR